MRAFSVFAIASFFVACSNTAPRTIVLNDDPGIPPCDGTQSPGETCWDVHDGEEPGRGVDARTSSAPLNTILFHYRIGHASSAHLSVTSYRDVMETAEEKTLLVQEEAHVRGALEPANVALGSCGPSTRPAPAGDALVRVTRGPMTLTAGKSNVVGGINQRGIHVGSTWSYETDYEHAVFANEPSWDLAFEEPGSPELPPFRMLDATGPIPTVAITAPTVTNDELSVAAGPLTIEWDETSARRMVISLPDAVCAVDPSARSFTIPKEVIGAPGEKFIRIEAGDIRRLGIPSLGRAILTMQLDSQSFALHVH